MLFFVKWVFLLIEALQLQTTLFSGLDAMVDVADDAYPKQVSDHEDSR